MSKYFFLFLKIVVAGILFQTLYFKFTGAPESKYIFETIGMEPWGRLGSGIAELIAAILILIPRTTWFGALLAIGTVTGAIYFHLTKLGIIIMDDGGLLFIMAWLVFLFSLTILWNERQNMPGVNKWMAK